LKSESLAFRVLTLENAAGHPQYLGNTHPYMQIKHLSSTDVSLCSLSNKASSQQPTSIIVAAPSAVNWMQVRIVRSLMSTNSGDSTVITECVLSIQESVDEVDPTVVNGCQQKLRGEAVSVYRG